MKFFIWLSFMTLCLIPSSTKYNFYYELFSQSTINGGVLLTFQQYELFNTRETFLVAISSRQSVLHNNGTIGWNCTRWLLQNNHRYPSNTFFDRHRRRSRPLSASSWIIPSSTHVRRGVGSNVTCPVYFVYALHNLRYIITDINVTVWAQIGTNINVAITEHPSPRRAVNVPRPISSPIPRRDLMGEEHSNRK